MLKKSFKSFAVLLASDSNRQFIDLGGNGGRGLMGQITTGIRSILSNPIVYNLSQQVMGARKARQWLVHEYIKPYPGMRILDYGCGTAEILSYLPEEINYFGAEPDEGYLALCREKYTNRGVFFSLEDVNLSAQISPNSLDLVMALGVLHHLEDAEAADFFDKAFGFLKSGGRVLTIDGVYVKGQNPIARLLISKDRGQNVRDVEGYKQLVPKRYSEIQGVIKHQSFIPYTHWVMACYK